MAKIELRFVQRFRDRHGTLRFYFRRKGCARVALPDRPGSEAFMAAYQLALASAEPPAPLRVLAGSIDALVSDYMRSDQFLKNRPVTQANDRNILRRFCQQHGSKPVRLLQQQHVRIILDGKAGLPGAQRNLKRNLRLLFDFAKDRGWRPDNPVTGIANVKRGKVEGHHSWSEEELELFESHWPVGSKPRLALALLLYTAVRREDVIHLGPANTRTGRLVYVQSKGRVPMDIPIAPQLAEVIEATPTLGIRTFIVTGAGAPFTAAGFGNWWRDRCRDAGLPDGCRAHGLRKAMLRRMAQAGCSEDFIASVSGHQDMREIRTYVRAANRARMADEGMAKTLARFS
jgi:integrase